MFSLASQPELQVTHYSGFNVKDFKFHTIHCDQNKKTQNSGVMVKGKNQDGGVSYNGTLKNIIELHYTEGNKFVLFNCDWYDTA